MNEKQVLEDFRRGLEMCHDAAAEGFVLAKAAGDRGKMKLARRAVRRVARMHQILKADLDELNAAGEVPGEIVAYYGDK